jgi:hypothetical protein
MQNSFAVLAVSLGFMLAGAYIGSWLRERLPEHHLNQESAAVVRTGVGLISTMAALILGLLISTAKIAYDSTATEVNKITAELVLVDQLLGQYGSDAGAAREALRGAAKLVAQSMWTGEDRLSGAFVPTEAAAKLSMALQSLPNQTETEHYRRKQIDDAVTRISQSRLRIFAESGAQLPLPFLAILIFWLTTIFASYSLFGQMNPTAIAFVFLFALSSSGALFLIAELNTPFQGILQLPRATIEGVLAPLPH